MAFLLHTGVLNYFFNKKSAQSSPLYNPSQGDCGKALKHAWTQFLSNSSPVVEKIVKALDADPKALAIYQKEHHEDGGIRKTWNDLLAKANTVITISKDAIYENSDKHLEEAVKVTKTSKGYLPSWMDNLSFSNAQPTLEPAPQYLPNVAAQAPRIPNVFSALFSKFPWTGSQLEIKPPRNLYYQGPLQQPKQMQDLWKKVTTQSIARNASESTAKVLNDTVTKPAVDLAHIGSGSSDFVKYLLGGLLTLASCYYFYNKFQSKSGEIEKAKQTHVDHLKKEIIALIESSEKPIESVNIASTHPEEKIECPLECQQPIETNPKKIGFVKKLFSYIQAILHVMRSIFELEGIAFKNHLL